MTNCVKCNTFQNKLRRGRLCNSCFDNQHPDASGITAGMPRFPNSGQNHQQSFASPRAPMVWNGEPPQGFAQNNQMDMTGFQHTASSSANVMVGGGFTPAGGRFASPSQQQTVIPSHLSSITADNINGLLQKPMSELTVGDIIQINRISNDPIQRQLNSIESELKGKIHALDTRVNILEQNKASIEEENAILRSTITNMQKSLNKIDSDTRNKNVIITGLPEGEIPVGNNQMLRNEEDKLRWILQLTENNHFNNRVEPFHAADWGNQSQDTTE